MYCPPPLASTYTGIYYSDIIPLDGVIKTFNVSQFFPASLFQKDYFQNRRGIESIVGSLLEVNG